MTAFVSLADVIFVKNKCIFIRSMHCHFLLVESIFVVTSGEQFLMYDQCAEQIA